MAEQVGSPNSPEQVESSSGGGLQSSPPPPVPAEQLQGPESGAVGASAVGEVLPPTQKRVPWAIIAVIVVPVLLVGVAALVLWQTGVLALLFPGPAVASVVPASTDIFISINANLESLPGYKHLADVYGELPSLKEGIEEATSGLEEQGLSFEDDLRPWLGREVGIAVTNLAATQEGGEPAVAYVAQSRNTRRSDAFLVKLQNNLTGRGYAVEKQEYSGVAYYQATRRGDSPLLFGAVKSFVVVAQSEQAMQGVIDVAQGKTDALAKNGRYTKMRSLLPAKAAAYLVFPNLQSLTETLMTTAGNAALGTVLGQVEAYESVGLAAVLEDDGIRVELATKLDTKAITPDMLAAMTTEPSAERILGSIPADVLAFFSGQRLDGAWQNVLARLKEMPDAEQQIQELGDSFGVPLDEDLFSWAPGEYAVALVSVEGVYGIGGFAVFEVSDQQKAAELLGKVAAVIEQASNAQFEDKVIGGNTVRVLAEPSTGEVVVSYGFIQDQLFVGVLGPVLERIVSGDFAKIADDKTFQQVLKHLPGRRTSNSYLSLTAIQNVLSSILGSGAGTGSWLDPVKAVGAAGAPYDAGNGVSRTTLFVYIP